MRLGCIGMIGEREEGGREKVKRQKERYRIK